jgi:hypothetical protein
MGWSWSLFAELKRRNVYKVAIACAVVGWLLIRRWQEKDKLKV